MDFDLNQEPLEPESHPPDSPDRLSVEMGDNQERIVERIRLLESVVARTRLRTSSSASGTPIPSSADVVPKPQFGSISSKIDGGTHLVAEALAKDSNCEQTLPSTSASTSTIQRKPGSIYDCNICFSLSKDPVLTCCGHLFCWRCFYRLPSTDSYSSKECPVCGGEVVENDITPIYGAASSPTDDDSIPPSTSTSNRRHPIKIPPRPRARRVETVRQRLGYPPLPPNLRVNPTSTPPRPRQQPPNLSRLMSQPGGSLGETIADHMAIFVTVEELPVAHTHTFHTADIFHSFAPPLPPQSQTGTSVTGGINGGNETVVSGSSSSSRRASVGAGIAVRGRRRRRRRG